MAMVMVVGVLLVAMGVVGIVVVADVVAVTVVVWRRLW